MFLRRGLPHRTQAHPRFLPTSPPTSLRFTGGARATSRQHREGGQAGADRDGPIQHVS